MRFFSPFAFQAAILTEGAVYVNLFMTVVSMVRIMLFWFRSCENIFLNSFRKLENWSIVALLTAALDAVTCALVG